MAHQGADLSAATVSALPAPGGRAVIVAHRGGLPAPENTLPAFRHALGTGAAFVETDVRLTRDQVPVLLHDATVDRTSDGQGPVAELALEELRGLDAGAWQDPRYAGTRIPTLDELLELLAPTAMKALLELKGEWALEQAAALVGLIRQRGLENRVVLQSFDTTTLDALAQAAPGIPRLLLTEEPLDATVDAVRAAGCAGLGTTAEAFLGPRDVIGELHAAGLVAFCFTVNDLEMAARLRAADVDGLITDLPALLGD